MIMLRGKKFWGDVENRQIGLFGYAGSVGFTFRLSFFGRFEREWFVKLNGDVT